MPLRGAKENTPACWSRSGSAQGSSSFSPPSAARCWRSTTTRTPLEEEASEFAQLTFHRVFENRDARFLESHASATRKTSRPAQFIHMAEDQLGTVQSVGPFGGKFTARLEGKRIVLNGRLQTRAMFETGGCWVHIAVSGSEGDWAIDHISWNY